MNKLLKLELDFQRRNKKQLKEHISKLNSFKCFEDTTDKKLVEYLITAYNTALDNSTAVYDMYDKLSKEVNKPKDNPDII